MPFRHNVQAFVLILVGTLLIALANDMFLIPNNVFSGGVTGIALIVNHFTGAPVGFMFFVFNVPLLAAGVFWLGGWRFVLRTLFAVVIMSLAIDGLAPFVPNITHDPLLYTLYGGLLSGVGGGLVFRGYGTTGGSDIVALLLQKWRGIPLNQTLVGFDVLVYAGAALVLGADKALYALIGSYAGGRMVGLIQEGLSDTRMLQIITTVPDALASRVLRDLGRGATFLRGQGAYTGADYRILMVVVRQQEINFVIDMVRDLDPQAFVIITDARAVHGEGFRPLPLPPDLPSGRRK
jgi:uncharacterized membrane-anchored protein YitT (DUF2179 family)